MEDISRELSSSLLGIGAVLLKPTEPFTWASGWKSPIYCDNRRILSSPRLRGKVASALADRARELCPDASVVAGVATGAIAWGVLVAEILGKPFVYVRPKPKDHGTRSRIEGSLPDGARVVVIEDLVSTGKSSLEAVDALREAGAEVSGMVAVFTYGFSVSAEAFADARVSLSTLSDYSVLVEEAVKSGYVDEAAAGVLHQWRQNPSGWGNNQ